MSRTDYKTPPASPHRHDHGLTKVDAALAGKAATTHTHPEISALTAQMAALTTRVTALESRVDLVTKPQAPANLVVTPMPGSVKLTWGVVTWP